MREARKLSLKRERLTELTSEQLDGVAGGLQATVAVYINRQTVTCTGTQGCASDNFDCPTVDGTCSCGCTYRDICGNVAIHAG